MFDWNIVRRPYGYPITGAPLTTQEVANAWASVGSPLNASGLVQVAQAIQRVQSLVLNGRFVVGNESLWLLPKSPEYIKARANSATGVALAGAVLMAAFIVPALPGSPLFGSSATTAAGTASATPGFSAAGSSAGGGPAFAGTAGSLAPAGGFVPGAASGMGAATGSSGILSTIQGALSSPIGQTVRTAASVLNPSTAPFMSGAGELIGGGTLAQAAGATASAALMAKLQAKAMATSQSGAPLIVMPTSSLPEQPRPKSNIALYALGALAAAAAFLS